MDLTEKLYMAVEQYGALSDATANRGHSSELSSNQTASNQKLSFSQLVSTVVNPTLDSSHKSMQIINQNVKYRRIYKDLIAESYLFHCPMQAAAATDETILTRRADTFELSVVTSEDLEDRGIHIILNIDDAAHSLKSTANIHCFYDDSIFPLALEQVSVQIYMAKISSRDAIYMALSHNDCEIFIR